MKTRMTWDDLGWYFGYPECCVKAFSTLAHVGGPPRKLYGTGYIPCLECNKKSKGALIETINSNRLARLPFPQEESFDAILNHIGDIFGEDVI